MRTRLIAVLVPLAFAGSALVAQGDPDQAVAGGGQMPAPWHARTDRGAPLDNVKFTIMPPGQHVTLGPAAIFWRDADTVSGSYTVEATLHQFGWPRHREGYGLFIGGKDLAGPGQRYTYFLISHVGSFTVKRRNGDSTTTLIDWTPAPSIVRPDSTQIPGAGKSVANTLTVRISGATASFAINGKDVWSGKAADVDGSGVVGYRVNHNLNIHLGPIAVTH